MTQVANLNQTTGMPVKTAAPSKQKASQELLEEFAGIMNQNTQNFFDASSDFDMGNDRNVDNSFSVDDATDHLQKDYEKFGSSGKRKIAQAKTEQPDHSAFSEKVQELTDQVKEAVRETMQVSAEDMETAMETLGFSAIDLLQPQNLAQLVQELTGNADASALLISSDFQMTMQEVSGLITDFQQENGFNDVQFSDLLAQLSEQVDELEETVKELLGLNTDAQEQQMTEEMQPEILMETTQEGQELTEETVQTIRPEAATAESEPAVQNVQENTRNSLDEPVVQPIAAEEETNRTAQNTGQDTNTGFQNEKNKQSFAADEDAFVPTEQHAELFWEQNVMANEQPQVLQAEAPQVQSYVEIEQLMDQMEGLARTFASMDETTVEMQLNPESLGRLVLTVTEKHGNVTAQIAASNEQVKEALQTQLVELRATLQAQGIKVEAVEVTVATHEFEQNLDGNTSANGQMQEQAQNQREGAQSGRRNLDRNSLDELSGLMSEEETLVAQMMRDNGGTVDYTA